MTTNPSNLLQKLSSPNSEVVISTLNSHVGVAEEVESILAKYQNKNLFFVGGVNKNFVSELKEKNGSGRASDSDIVEKNYFFIDIDIRKFIYTKRKMIISQEFLLEIIDGIKEKINNDPLFAQWSCINCSGNGVHIFYIGKHMAIAEEIYKAGVKHIYKKFIENVGNKLEYNGDRINFPIDTSCCNIGHLVRLPGSMNHKKDYKNNEIDNITACEILYEQNIESELFNNIPLYAAEENNNPDEIMMQNTKACLSSSGYISTIPNSLMDKINKKPLVDLVLQYTGRDLGPDGRNFIGGSKDTGYKGCFMHEVFLNVLVVDGTPHIPNPKNLQAHNTYTFIRDVLCGGSDSETFKKAKELYPDLADNKCDDIEIGNPFDHFVTYGEVLEQAVKERRALDINNACKYGIKILDEYLGGILPSELVVIGAETGLGKSELAYIIGRENSRSGKKVMLFELEGDLSEIALRDIQGLTNSKLQIPLRTVQYRFNLDKSIYHVEDKVIAEMNSDVKSNLFIFNKIEIPTLNFLKQIIEKAKDNVDMIIIDHLHYIYLERDEELRQIGEIMRTLKTISDIIKKPIILISHLRKKTNNTKEREPSIDDLYGSSNIGKEATTVLLLNKMRVADARSLNNELPIEDIDKRYCGTKIIVAKSRIGLPKSAFGLIYDTQKKIYMPKYQQLIENESGARQEDRLVDPSTIEV